MEAVLNNIRSKHNVGSIFRTSDAAGVSKVYLCGYSPAPIDKHGKPNSQLIKVSLGAEDYVDWEQVEGSCEDFLKRMKEDGYLIWVLEQDGRSIDYSKVEIDKSDWDRILLVLGNEVEGTPDSILDLADQIIEVSMYGNKASLNVSVVFGVVAYGLRSRL